MFFVFAEPFCHFVEPFQRLKDFKCIEIALKTELSKVKIKTNYILQNGNLYKNIHTLIYDKFFLTQE